MTKMIEERPMKLKLLITLSLAVLSVGQTIAADAEAGKAKAAVCAGCHGPDGMSFMPTYPNLKGQKAAYLLKQLKDFKTGYRKGPIMASQVSSLSDDDMANIAAFYEGLAKK
jgi:cytochrome c553